MPLAAAGCPRARPAAGARVGPQGVSEAFVSHLIVKEENKTVKTSGRILAPHYKQCSWRCCRRHPPCFLLLLVLCTPAPSCVWCSLRSAEPLWWERPQPCSPFSREVSGCSLHPAACYPRPGLLHALLSALTQWGSALLPAVTAWHGLSKVPPDAIFCTETHPAVVSV